MTIHISIYHDDMELPDLVTDKKNLILTYYFKLIWSWHGYTLVIMTLHHGVNRLQM